MFAPLLITMLLSADPVPVAGRPADFSGAIGGPFVVTTTATPIETHVGEPITFTLRVTGPGDLSQMRRPDLENNPEFASRFTVEDGADKLIADPSGREFEYTLRARSLDVNVIPRVKLVYFNPAIMPADRGFQTTYSENIEINLTRPPTIAETTTDIPLHIREWIEKNHSWKVTYNDMLVARDHQDWMDWFLERLHLPPRDDKSSVPICFALILGLLPPVLCTTWYRLKFGKRLRAPDIHQTTIVHLNGVLANQPDQVADVFCEFIASRIDQPLKGITSVELEVLLRGREIAEDLVQESVSLLQECEKRRFGRPDSSFDLKLVDKAIAIVHHWKTNQ